MPKHKLESSLKKVQEEKDIENYILFEINFDEDKNFTQEPKKDDFIQVDSEANEKTIFVMSNKNRLSEEVENITQEF